MSGPAASAGRSFPLGGVGAGGGGQAVFDRGFEVRRDRRPYPGGGRVQKVVGVGDVQSGAARGRRAVQGFGAAGLVEQLLGAGVLVEPREEYPIARVFEVFGVEISCELQLVTVADDEAAADLGDEVGVGAGGQEGAGRPFWLAWARGPGVPCGEQRGVEAVMEELLGGVEPVVGLEAFEGALHDVYEEADGGTAVAGLASDEVGER